MAKKSKGHRMPVWRRYLKAGVGLAGKGVGAGVALSPIILRAQQNLPSGNFANFLEQTKLDYTAADGKDLNRGAVTYGSLLGGFVIMAVTKAIARRL